MKTNGVSDRIRAAIQKNPQKMTLQLARDLGVPEVEVIRAFPTDRVMELDIAHLEGLLRRFEALGSVRVLVSNGATTIEVDGTFGGFSMAGEFFNVQTDSLDMHIPLGFPYRSLNWTLCICFLKERIPGPGP